MKPVYQSPFTNVACKNVDYLRIKRHATSKVGMDNELRQYIPNHYPVYITKVTCSKNADWFRIDKHASTTT